ncbi:MAG: type II toxin-antitoxin system RelE/ParE family toxin [Thermoplasmata archaeon]|nr:MAG: type II toxin-antitoxin system RelE/ParE family toxin [Thermoplasmata archaeon]
MTFEVHLSSRAKRFLNKTDKELYNRIMNKLYNLAEDPFPHDVKRVIGQKERVFRVRVGSHRILYVVFPDKNVILVVNIDKRPKAY